MILFSSDSALKRWLPVSVLVLLMAVLQLIGPEVFRYENRLIEQGQLWRMLCGHWVHANWIHYGLNVAGLLLCVALTQITWGSWQWAWRILLLSLGISVAFLIFHPDISWYVGFSGVLFGLYVMSSLKVWSQQRLMSSLILLFIVVKIGLEQWGGVQSTSSEWIRVPVLVDAHAYGVLIALLIVALRRLWAQFSSGAD